MIYRLFENVEFLEWEGRGEKSQREYIFVTWLHFGRIKYYHTVLK